MPDIETPDAERMVLSAMLTDSRAVWLAREVTQPDEFMDWRNRAVFEAISKLAIAGSPTDPVAVNSALEQAGELARVGATFTWEVQGFASTWTNVAYYARIVHEAAVLRAVRTAAAQMLSETENVSDPIVALAAARRILDTADQEAHPAVQTIGDVLAQVIESLDEKPVFFRTPWPSLNNRIIGCKPGGLHVFAARPGSGKTILALQLARELANQGPVAFASLEMSRADLIKRLIAAESEVLVGNVFASTLSGTDFEKIARVRPTISSLPIVIEDEPHLLSSVAKIQAFAKSVQRKHGKLAGLFIDYLQLIPNRSGQSKYESMSEITRDLKLLAKELDCPIIALAQLNRESEKNNRAPALSDLRDSGTIEQDADVVVMMQRRLAEDGQPGDDIDVWVRKARHGQVGHFTLMWAAKFARLDNPVWIPEHLNYSKEIN